MRTAIASIAAGIALSALVLGGYAARVAALHRVGKRLAQYERP